RFSIPIIPTTLIGYLSSNYLDALFITHFLSQAKLGIYSVAYQLAGLTQQLPLLAGTLLMPLFVTLQTAKREDRTERFIREVLPFITLLWTIACALLATIGSYMVPLVFGSKFEETAVLLWPLMAVSAFAGPWLMGYGPIVTTSSKTYLILIAATLGAIANVVLDWMLIPRFGLLGCAWGTVVASGLNLGMIFYLVHWRIVPRRTWVLQATLPIFFGAVYASLRGENIGALGLTAIVSGVIGLAHRKSIIQAVKNIGEYGRFAFYASKT